MTLKEIEVLLQNAVGGIDRIYEHWTGCDGSVVNLPDYTVVIDRTGGYHVMHEDGAYMAQEQPVNRYSDGVLQRRGMLL